MRVFLLIYFISGVYQTSECILLKKKDSFATHATQHFENVTFLIHNFSYFADVEMFTKITFLSLQNRSGW